MSIFVMMSVIKIEKRKKVKNFKKICQNLIIIAFLASLVIVVALMLVRLVIALMATKIRLGVRVMIISDLKRIILKFAIIVSKR